MSDFDPRGPENSNNEHLLALGAEFERVVAGIPELKNAIVRRAMGAEAYDRAVDKEILENDIVRDLPREESATYHAQSTQNQILYGVEVNGDPDLGLRECFMNALIGYEEAELEGLSVGYGDEHYVQTGTEHYESADGKQMLRYTKYRVVSGKVVAEHHDFQVGSMVDDREAALVAERALGLNGRPLGEADADDITARLGAYHDRLEALAAAEPERIYRRLGLFN